MLHAGAKPIDVKKHYTTLYLRRLGIILVNPYKNWNVDNTPLIAYKEGERAVYYDGYYQNAELFVAIENNDGRNNLRKNKAE